MLIIKLLLSYTLGISLLPEGMGTVESYGVMSTYGLRKFELPALANGDSVETSGLIKLRCNKSVQHKRIEANKSYSFGKGRS